MTSHFTGTKLMMDSTRRRLV